MKINRRRFLATTALVGGGVLIGYSATRPSRHRRANEEMAENGQHFVTSWLKIDPNNEVTVYVPHSEMGQGCTHLIIHDGRR
jgi:isoquinoline 1-oxidoreductase beta subunit